MIRIYFGYLFSASSDTDWADAVGADHTFPAFLEGSINIVSAVPYNVHKRIPQAVASAGLENWREYIDLYHAAIDPSVNEMTKAFTDMMGVVTYIQTPTAGSGGTLLSGGVINAIELESLPNEFFGKTRFRDLPVPDATKGNTPRLYASNETLAADPSLAITGYRTFSVTVDPSVPALGESYASAEAVVPINDANNDDILLVLHNSIGYTTTTANVYRGDMTQRTENGKVYMVHDDFLRKVNTSVLNMEAFGWNPLIPGSPYTANWANETTYPYVAKTPAPAPFCPFEPFNDVLPRIALDFYNRNRPGTETTWLVMNTQTHEYFKCVVLNVTPLFLMGKDAVSDTSAIITLGVIEQGSFTNDGLEDPLNSDYFTAINRTYGN